MRYRYLLGLGAALAVALSWGGARAQLVSMPRGPGGWYFGGEGGWTSLAGATDHVAGAGAVHQSFGDGFNIGARAGYEWGPLRLEEEFRWQKNDIDSIAGVPVSGSRDAYALMTNLIYDFTFGWPITPHLGAGVGAVDVHDSWSVPGGAAASSDSWEFGYQAIAGLRYNINPSLAFDLDYRYLATTDPTFQTTLPGVSYRSEYASHSVIASLSLRFGAAPPPPPLAAAPPPPLAAAPPAPAPVVRKVFLVFFDWDQDTVTPEGIAIIHRAADAWHAGAPVTIEVSGYTDRSGSAGYNQRLSQRRAHNVAVALAGFGVPQNEMAVNGRGETDNRVPTANGVREPQNRRVEIVF
ncbi:MAG TPA: OmpA family protein [Stellaceae bacterium]|nr:OmpA family protein [Stellaceae bacterium]